MPLLSFGSDTDTTTDPFADYLTSALQTGLSLTTGVGGDFAVRCKISDWQDAGGETHPAGVVVVPHYPVARKLDFEFYTDIYKCLSVAAFPYYTLLKPSGLQLLELPGESYETSRGLFFPWLKGTPKRLVYTHREYMNSYLSHLKTHSMKIPLMEGFNLDFSSTTHVAIAGQSGAGKSYFVRFFLPYLVTMGQLYLVDPKADDLVRWAGSPEARDVFKSIHRTPNVVYPQLVGSKDGVFVKEVDSVLAKLKAIMMEREDHYMKTGKRDFDDIFIVIDELLALTQGAAKVDKESFFAHLQSLALLGRSAKIHLILVSQRFSAEAMPTAIRDQLQGVFQLGPITKSNTAFLFPDYDSEGVIPPRGRGTGICQIQGDVIPYPRPFLSPTYA